MMNIQFPSIKMINFIFLLLLIITFSTCKDNIVGPEIKPGRRDYTWKADTLIIPFTYLDRIWGSAPDDVWAIGSGGDLDKTIYHYDGVSWKTDGISRKINPSSIWGFASNDVWLGGEGGRIWHFNGKTWSESLWLGMDFVQSGFMDIWGDSPRNIYTVGFLDSAGTRKGIMYHYTGLKWLRINVDYKHGTLMRIKRGLNSSNKYYVWALWEDPYVNDTTKIFEFDEKKLKLIYSEPYMRSNNVFLQPINSKMYFTIGYSINTLSNNRFSPIVRINNPKFGIQFYGRSEKDILLRMDDGIAHYNGTDIQYLIKFNGSDIIREGILFDNYAFFLTNNFQSQSYLNVIYIGKNKRNRIIHG